MIVHLKRSDRPAEARWERVLSYAHASYVVRLYIAKEDLGAGCSFMPAFEGGEIVDDNGCKYLGKVSYNGRVWDANEQEINIHAR